MVSANNYYPFGMTMQNDDNVTAENYRYGFNGMEKDDEVKGQGNSYTTEFRKYDGLSEDSITHPMYSPYSAFDNNPIYYADPSGANSENGGGDGDDLERKKELVSSAGKLLKAIYESYHSNKVISKTTEIHLNYGVLPPLKVSATLITEKGNKANWNDMTLMYMLEFGGEIDEKYDSPVLKIKGKNAPAIKQLRSHEGVTEAKEKAREIAKNLKPGESSTSTHTWVYNFEDMKRNLTDDWQDLEVFLGSYTISTDITKDKYGKVTYSYKVVNESHLESLTRFIRHKNGPNEGAIPDKKRGEGVHMGGDFIQEFTWKETQEAQLTPRPKRKRKR